MFGVRRAAVASFEEPVRRLEGRYGYIDLIWKGRVLVEHKSLGESLDKAKSQAFQYIQELASADRQDEIPRYVIVSDFARIALYDLEPEEQLDLPLFAGVRAVKLAEFPLSEFPSQVRQFAFMAGYQTYRVHEQDPINIDATQIMAHLHDVLTEGGYEGHDLERFLVRILFCLFAEDTGIFEPEAFHLFIRNRTTPDGSDLGSKLANLFEVLDTDVAKRSKYLDEELAEFPYVNGELFRERLRFADFTKPMREALLTCCDFNWAQISPAIFGSLFQEVIKDHGERRQIGAHYTSERDILKVVHSLFLDDLRAEFESAKADRSTGRRARLNRLHERLSKLTFLDPACGCGNFLVIAFRELRQLELDLLLDLHGTQQAFSHEELTLLCRVDVNQLYGIEIKEWPARVAEVALWFTDHQMNLKVTQAFSTVYERIPLRASPHIRNDNALRTNWNDLLPSDQCSYILGNPPFVGKNLMTPEQDEDVRQVAGEVKGVQLLDYVCAWYFKTAEYIRGSKIRAAFVSTNSITQGEQVGVLWRDLFSRYQVKILFAHRTFSWQSEARGKAHVHVVIIGFAELDQEKKAITDYDPKTGQANTEIVRNISPYLVEGSDTVVVSRRRPARAGTPEITFGNMPNDDGGLILDFAERNAILKNCRSSDSWIRTLMGSEEFINGKARWCLWLLEIEPSEYRPCPEVMQRVQAVRNYRLASKRAATKALASTPGLFGEIRQPRNRYILVPRHSSETRPYIPIGYLDPEIIVHDSCCAIPAATLYHFAILTSCMHMAWVKQICGRIKSDFRYSNTLVYNNFPWPDNVTEKQEAHVRELAQDVLDSRERYPESTLADLYDPLAMPFDLLRAHQTLDRAVDRLYRNEPFLSDRQRVEFLFTLYEKLNAPLLSAPVRKRRTRKT